MQHSIQRWACSVARLAWCQPDLISTAHLRDPHHWWRYVHLWKHQLHSQPSVWGSTAPAATVGGTGLATGCKWEKNYHKYIYNVKKETSCKGARLDGLQTNPHYMTPLWQNPLWRNPQQSSVSWQNHPDHQSKHSTQIKVVFVQSLKLTNPYCKTTRLCRICLHLRCWVELQSSQQGSDTQVIPKTS